MIQSGLKWIAFLKILLSPEMILKPIPLMIALLVWVCAGPGLAYAEVVEIDSNFDGKIDQWQHLTADGKKSKVECSISTTSHSKPA